MTIKLSNAIFLTAFLFALTCFSFMTYSLYESQQQRQQGHEWIRQTGEIIESLDQVLTLALNAETGTRGYLLSGQQVALEPYRSAHHELLLTFNALRLLMATNPVQKRQLDGLRQLVQQRLQISKSLIDQRRLGINPDLAQREISQGKPVMDRIRRQITHMKAVEHQLLTFRQMSLLEATRQGRWWGRWLVSISLLMLLTAASLIYVLRKSLYQQRRLRLLQDKLRAQITQQHEQRAFLKHVVNGSLNGLLACAPVFDLKGQLVDLRITLANQVASGLNRLTTDEMIGQTLLTLFPTLADTPLMAGYLLVARTGEGQRLDTQYQSVEMDAWFDVAVTPLPDQGCLISFLDITHRKLAEAELQRQTNQLRTTLDASLNSIMSMTASRNDQGEITDFRMDTANAPVKRMTRRDLGEILGRSLLDIFPGNAKNGFLDLYKRVVTTGQPEQSMQYYQDDLGLEGWFEVSAVKQESDGVVVTFINVTDRQRAQQTAELTLRQLQESNENLAQFAFVASHDLQAPLRKIQQFGSLLLQQHGSALPESGVDLLNRMNASAGRMSDLVRGLLDYSRLDASDSLHEVVALEPLLEGVLSDLEIVIEEKHATILRDELPRVWGNPFQLQQLFSNLLTNALKFTRPTEKPLVQVRCQVVPGYALKDELIANQNRNASYYALSVIDNGIGFDQTYADRIFKLFERLHGKTAYPGSGIGLAVCKQVVDKHQGLLSVESRPDEGSTFVVYLPIVTRFDIA